ncbi:MAG TPA: ATP-binding protein [Burkholderiales bacterium]|nr:ATP-binding protein [Burkholderiales bacterium]
MTSGRAPRSIKGRLLAMLLGTVAVVWLATAGYSYWDARLEIDELLDAHLAQSAALLVAQAGHELEEIDVEHAPQLHKYERRVAFQIWERGRTLRLHSANAPNDRFSARDEGFSDAVVGDRRWRVFSSWDAKRRFLIQVGEQREARDEIAARIGRNLLAPLVFALLVLGVLVYLGVSRATRPLATVQGQVAQRDPENLQPIAVDDCPAEVVPLVDGLNRLFGRVTRSIENERRFTADAAHELRTPIAALRVQAQVARGAADDRGRQRALDNVIAGCDRATHLVEQLLTLARLDPAYMRFQPEPCDLRTVAKAVIGEIAPGAVAKGVEIELDEGPPALARGDAGLLAILVRNLVDNAVRYSPSRTTVRVRIDPAGGRAGPALIVTDQGPGVPAEALQCLGDRFYRAMGTGESGSGLGLSIVKRIAELHDAAVSFDAGPGGQGLLAKVAFARREGT